MSKTVWRLWAGALAVFVVCVGWAMWGEWARLNEFCTDPANDIVGYPIRLSECDWWLGRFNPQEMARREAARRYWFTVRGEAFRRSVAAGRRILPWAEQFIDESKK
jgi:hypothetical protein